MEQPLWYFQRPAHRHKFIRLRTTATLSRSLIWRHLPMGTQRRPHRRTRHRRSMQPRFIHHRQSTWCQLPSTRLQWCRAITQRPWFRSQYMPTPRGIGGLRAWVARRRPPVWVALNTSFGTIREPSWLPHRPVFEADSRGPGAARRGSPRPGPLDLCISVFIKRPCRCVSVPAQGWELLHEVEVFL